MIASWTADDGTIIHYEHHGQGGNKPRLLLLPGLLGSISRQWQRFISPLSRDFEIILPDWRGHGRSTNTAKTLEPQRLYEDLSGLLDAVDWPQFHIAGYDIGGYLGLMLAVNQPRRVQTLLLHGTKFYWTREAVAGMRQGLDPDVMADNVPGYATQLAHEHGGHWRSLVRQAADLVGLLSEQGLAEGVVAQVRCPVLVSVGDRDELVNLPEAYRLSRVFRHGQLLVLPGVHHPFPANQTVPLLPMMQVFHGGDS